MTDYKATPKQWETDAARWPEAILEIRTRVEVLEANSSAPLTSSNYPEKPDSSLVKRVRNAIASEYDPKDYCWDEARAAIREVAAWLNEAPLDLYPGDRGIVVNALYDQANQ